MVAIEPARGTRVEAFHAEILPPEKRAQLAAALPRHIRPELFERNLLNALMAQPDLLKCDPREVFREVAQIAALGLLLDPQLGEAYLIVGYSQKQSRHKPQRRVGYRGLIKLARQSGEVSQIYAHEVRQRDELEVNLGTVKRFEHRPDIFGPRGEVIGFYAVVKYRDGSDDFEPMSLAEVNRIRDRSDAWRAWKAGKASKPPPWETDPIEMGKKTVLRRLCKRVPQSPDLAEALKLEMAQEEGAAGEEDAEMLTPPRGRPRLAHAGNRLPAPSGGRQEPAAAEPPRAPPAEPEPASEPDNGPDEPSEDEAIDDESGSEEAGPDQEQGESDFPPDVEARAREAVLARAREAAMKGSRKLHFHLNTIKLSDREMIGPNELAELERAAKQANGR